MEPDGGPERTKTSPAKGRSAGGLSLLIVFVLWLRHSGPLRDFVNEEPLHDLGKLLFAFSTFWMYT